MRSALPLAAVHDLGSFACYAMDRWLDRICAGQCERVQQELQPGLLEAQQRAAVLNALDLGGEHQVAQPLTTVTHES